MQTLKNGIKTRKFVVLVVLVGLAAFVTLCLLMLSCEAYVFRTTKVLMDEIPIGSKFVEIESYGFGRSFVYEWTKQSVLTNTTVNNEYGIFEPSEFKWVSDLPESERKDFTGEVVYMATPFATGDTAGVILIYIDGTLRYKQFWRFPS